VLLTSSTPPGAPGRDDARRRVELILRAKAVELGKPDLVRDAEGYELDARFLQDLGVGDAEIA